MLASSWITSLRVIIVLASVGGVACGYPALPRATDVADAPTDVSNDDSVVSVCGNSTVEAGEECEDDNANDGDGCDNNCTFTRCGNAVKTDGEECDDGNEITESCPYGIPACTVCTSTCKQVVGAISVCGDGRMDPAFEACDDGNALPCGTCSADCKMAIPATSATGQISMMSAALVTGDAFTVDDGLGTLTRFTFVAGGPGVNEIRIETVSLTADNIANAINSSALLIAADAPGTAGTVTLIHQRLTSRGNRAITENVQTPTFSVSGMSGGQAGDCAASTGCVSDDDCESHLCENRQCRVATPGARVADPAGE